MSLRLRILLVLLFSASSGSAEPMVVYKLDPAQSELVVQLFKAGVGSVFAHDHVVRATQYAGRIEGDPAVPATVSIVVEVQTASLRADEPAVRQKYGLMALPSDQDREDIQRTMESATQLDVARYPIMRFRSTRIEPRAEERFVVTGELTIRDVVRPFTFPVVVERCGDTLHGRGSFRFRQSSFGYQPYSAFLGSVRNQDEVLLHFDVVAAR
jgi:polyisoprenoid-binding protein YceI